MLKYNNFQKYNNIQFAIMENNSSIAYKTFASQFSDHHQ